MVKVKICGITNLDDALIAQDAGADIIGFIFAQSPRRIEPEKAADIISRLSPDIKVSALFVNEEKEVVDKTIKRLIKVDFIQFHGDENMQYCQQFMDRKIIKVFRIKDEASLEQIASFKEINYILLDTFKDQQYGGTGKVFDWDIAVKAKRYEIPVFLSGGLNPDNVQEAISKVKPYGVDVSSGVEEYPGKKDAQLVKRFITLAKAV